MLMHGKCLKSFIFGFFFILSGHFGEIADENTIHNHHQFVCISFAGKPNIPFMIIAHGMYLKCTQRASK